MTLSIKELERQVKFLTKALESEKSEAAHFMKQSAQERE